MIPFNKPYYSGKESREITRVLNTGMLTGEIDVIRKCEELLKQKYKFNSAWLTNSCTMSLEIAALLTISGPADEVIMPSFTYVSTANAFALRGAKIIFADSLSESPAMDADHVERLISPRTKVIVAVHYGGVACDIARLKQLCDKHSIFLVEDAAQCIDSYYKNKPLGSTGHISCFSFHETKNIHCGEGGFIVINDASLREKADVIRHKGTNRSAFISKKVPRYEWVGLGHSAIPSGISAAFLSAQLPDIEKVTARRRKLWEKYYSLLAPFQDRGYRIPVLPENAQHNAHIFYIVCRSPDERSKLISWLASNDVHAVFHYQSLDNSPYLRESGVAVAPLPNSKRYSDCLLRLPMYYNLRLSEVEKVCKLVIDFYLKG